MGLSQCVECHVMECDQALCCFAPHVRYILWDQVQYAIKYMSCGIHLQVHCVADAQGRHSVSKVCRQHLRRGLVLSAVRYIVLETRKDGTKFTNRGLKDAAERLNAAAAKYEALQKDLVAQVGGGGEGCLYVRGKGWCVSVCVCGGGGCRTGSGGHQKDCQQWLASSARGRLLDGRCRRIWWPG
jgi:hypothetical protein